MSSGHTRASRARRIAGVLGRAALAACLAAGTALLSRRGVRRPLQQPPSPAGTEALRHRSLLATVTDAILVIDERGTVLSFNPAAERMFGYRADEILGHGLALIMPAGEGARHDGYIGRYLATGEERIIGIGREVTARRRNGEEFPVELTVSEMRVGERREFTGVLRDISLRRRAEQALVESEQRLQLALQGGNLGIWDLDVASGQVAPDPMAVRMLDYVPGKAGAPMTGWERLVHPRERGFVKGAIADLVEGRSDRFRCEFRVRARRGGWKWLLSLGGIAARDAQGRPLRVTGVCLDIDERKRAEERVLQVARHDALTGLPNRALTLEFGERLLSAARRGGTRCAILFIDLDRFKPVNDSYGHEVGDAVLREVAHRLGSCVRSEDVFGRLGGDEFLAVLSRIHSADDAAQAARHLLGCLERPIRIGKLELHVSPSIGISLFPADSEAFEALIKKADAAMYHAKERGRANFQFYTPELNERVCAMASMENRLRAGLQRADFSLHFQPVIDVEQRSVAGAEALLRWTAEEALGPDEFVSVAEATGVIHELGDFALRAACGHQRRWLDAGLPPLLVSVNVSPVQFRQPGFARAVARAVARAGIPPSSLQLEITDGAPTRGSDDLIPALQALKEVGVQIALDDFGSRFSSLAHLSSLPLDAVKVGQALVRRATAEPASLAVAEAVVSVGRALGLRVVAEGVESAELAALLQQKSCRYMQGYHFAAPMAPEAFEAWYRAWLDGGRADAG